VELFLDTGELSEIESAAQTGLVDGVTTNPSLVAKTGLSLEGLVEKICGIVDGPVSAEVISVDEKGMLAEAEKLAAIHPNVVIKLPLTQEGLKACKKLSARGVKTNVTLCFSPLQGLLAAKAGATYVSPFVGRLDDIGHFGMGLIGELREIFDNYGFQTRILVASVRHPEHLLEAAKIGAETATIPYGVFQKLVHHPLTKSGLDRFLSDWEKAPQV